MRIINLLAFGFFEAYCLAAGQGCSDKKCVDCVKAGCDWCAAVISKSAVEEDMKLGYCTAKGAACEKTKFGTLDSLLPFRDYLNREIDWTIVTVPYADAVCPENSDSPLIAGMETCEDCQQVAGAHWCQLDVTTGTGTLVQYLKSGGVCLTTGVGKSTDCIQLGKDIGPTKTSLIDPGDCPTAACTSMSCHTCRNNRCTWCGTRINHYSSGKLSKQEEMSLGKCVKMDTSTLGKPCSDVKFSDLQDIYSYKINSYEYRWEVAPFSTTDKWNNCRTNPTVDPNTINVDTCEKCTERNIPWCEVVSKDFSDKERKKTGMCLGSSAKYICTSLQRPATADQYSVETKLMLKCNPEPDAARRPTSTAGVVLALSLVFAEIWIIS